MKIPTHILTGVALFAAALSSSYAQTATTTPVGYRTETLKTGFNLLAPNLNNKVEAAGVIDGVTGTTIDDNDVDFSALGTADLILKITTAGSTQGRLVQVNTTAGNVHRLTAASSTTGVVVGNSYELRKSLTVSGLLGAGAGAVAPAPFTAGADETSADTVYLPTGPGVFAVIFYSDGSFYSAGWKDTNGDDASAVEILPTTSLFIRNLGAQKDVVFTGHVDTKQTLTTVAQNINFVSRGLPVPYKLSESGFDGAGFLAAGADETSADNVFIPTGPGVYKITFKSDGSFYPAGWTDTDGNPAGAVEVTSGIIVKRIAPGNGPLILPIVAGLDL